MTVCACVHVLSQVFLSSLSLEIREVGFAFIHSSGVKADVEVGNTR
jgi:hypothetical protein